MAQFRAAHLLSGILTLSALCGHSIAWAHPGSTAAVSSDKVLSVPAVVAKVRSSVVTILTRGVPASPAQAQSGSGSGVIIDDGGYILTNNHLVIGVKSMVVGLSTGRLTPGRVVARDFLRSEEHTSELQSQSNLVC